ncbi:hypothetical protein OPT61_g9022 [Boeremia exigua]|uniref:Uncharacterized protein n=1 Tax=Boeremia exigua TaxID=749465 RepID=A0ACC2HVU0_9PLEO|nr:hypothetical protein OPT61_g9022 [Boeremia exigua]
MSGSAEAAKPADSSTCICCKRSKTEGAFFELEAHSPDETPHYAWRAYSCVFLQASEQGCQRCAVVFEMATAWQKDNPGNYGNYIMVISIYFAVPDLAVRLTRSEGSWSSSDPVLELLSANPSGSTGLLKSFEDQLNIITKPLWSEDATSDDALQESIESLERCLAHHKYCTNIPSKLPKRCLELNQTTMTLRDTASCLTVEPYACLSHCWGPEGPSLKLTPATEFRLRQGVDLDTLPRTFSEAAKVCLKMGVRFLWIDALCIIQGDKADWKEAAATMASIYENAYFTIAATGADNSDDGLRPFKEESKPVRLGTSDIFVRKLREKVDCMLYGTHNSKTWPLLSRAWAFQEGQLSPRMLRFSCYGIVWDCRTTRVEREEGKSKVSLGADAIDLLPFLFLYSSGLTKSTDVEVAWHNTVAEYSKLRLTYHTDKLPAIAALAQHMAKLRPTDTYVAGMWRNTLLSDLQWRALKGRLSKESKLPTWSWASIRKVLYISTDFVLKGVEIDNLSYTSVGPAEIGCIENAILTIQGRALPIRARFDPTKSWQQLGASDLTDLAVFSKRHIMLSFDCKFSTDNVLGEDHSLLALFLGGNSAGLHGLILRQIGNLYKRIGDCTMNTPFDGGKELEATIEEMDSAPLSKVRII